MTKKKNFHGVRSGNRQVKAYAFFHRQAPYGHMTRTLKKAPASAANTAEGKAEQTLTGTVSASTIHENGGNVK